jgi:hypothetical protein
MPTTIDKLAANTMAGVMSGFENRDRSIALAQADPEGETRETAAEDGDGFLHTKG